MKQQEGFTLIELLAVIVILAVILAIAVPQISSIIQSSTQSAMRIDANMILQQLSTEELEDKSFTITSINRDTIANYGISNSNYDQLAVSISNGEPYIAIIGKNKWANLKACGTHEDIKVVSVDDTTICPDITDIANNYNPGMGVNGPILAEGMTPVKWNGTTWVYTREDDPEWYSYTTTDKKWANAKTADGSMWVWIPRFIYQIYGYWHQGNTYAERVFIQFSHGINDNWNNSIIGNISTATTANASNFLWTNEPAFTFGTRELTGFWISKFEASNNNGDIESKPNVVSLGGIDVSGAFNDCLYMVNSNHYGWTTSNHPISTHLIKNIEWGAVSYLAQSNYGMYSEVWINNSIAYVTGCGGDSPIATPYSECQYSYDTTNGQKTSTTSNIYGVYDMSGGRAEFVAAYVYNISDNFTSWLDNHPVELRDRYEPDGAYTATGIYNLTINHKGDALYESSNYPPRGGPVSWNFDALLIPNYNTLIFTRGSNGIFAVGYDGGFGGPIGFRPVILTAK